MEIQNAFRRLYSLRTIRVTAQCLFASLAIALLTYGGFVTQANMTTISFLYLLLVIAVALYCSFWQASLTSLLAVACLDFFFTPPIFHFYVTDPKEWVALGVFEI